MTQTCQPQNAVSANDKRCDQQMSFYVLFIREGKLEELEGPGGQNVLALLMASSASSTN